MSVLNQKFRGRKTKYIFGDKELSYEYADSEDSVAFEVNYHEINVEDSIKSTSKNPIWKFGSYPFALLALFAIGKASLVAESFAELLAATILALFWILIAGIFWVKYQRSKVSLTMFDSIRGRLIVIHDGQEQEIIKLMQNLVSTATQEIKGLDRGRVQ